MKMTKLLTVFTICLSFHVASSETDFLTQFSKKTLAEDGKLNFTQLATKYGHDADQYDVVTEDGYILTMFHIPGAKPPVLLFHGILDTADTFIIRGNTSLVITLAKAGYDLWIGNSRGNKYARRHITLNPDTDKTFWDYSVDENGKYDLRALIDFICNQTGVDSISTISHSQGTAAHYVLGSVRPEYNAKIKVAITFAPIAFLNNLIPPVSLVALAGPVINTLLETLQMEELLQNDKAVSDLLKFICSKGTVSYLVCELGGLLPLSGFDPQSIEPAFLNVLFGHYPAAISRKSLNHFDQIALGRRFCQYDYGTKDNLAKYGTSKPPDYDLSAVTMQIALFVGKNDPISRMEDVEQLKKSLPNVVQHKVMEPELWNHADFVWGSNMTEYLYPSVFEVLEKYN